MIAYDVCNRSVFKELAITGITFREFNSKGTSQVKFGVILMLDSEHKSSLDISSRYEENGDKRNIILAPEKNGTMESHIGGDICWQVRFERLLNTPSSLFTVMDCVANGPLSERRCFDRFR
ncbi:hypothetical protein NPIL_274251 [Nephila pilipes]|uniref:Uncharacterized protein n=1 Tax=Nephila pilipes TaxID=299642 RepID=A0A8X6PBL1_NEPPI|nr:hypothetical protein NPIL_274251 [Nephila pilipes]